MNSCSPFSPFYSKWVFFNPKPLAAHYTPIEPAPKPPTFVDKLIIQRCPWLAPVRRMGRAFDQKRDYVPNLREQRTATLKAYRDGLAGIFYNPELASEIVETWTFECAGTPYLAIRIRTTFDAGGAM